MSKPSSTGWVFSGISKFKAGADLPLSYLLFPFTLGACQSIWGG